MVYYAGIDLGKRKSHIKVITAEREVVEDLKIENDPKEFARVFRKYKGQIVAGCEATSNAFWVADTLEPLCWASDLERPLFAGFRGRIIGRSTIEDLMIDKQATLRDVPA